MRLALRTGGFPTGLFLASAGVSGAGVVALLHLDRLPLVLCGFRSLTGLPCATCGATRAFGRLVRLDLTGALLLNPLVTLGALLVVLWGAADLLLILRGRRLGLHASAGEAKILGAGVFVAFLVNWVYVLWSFAAVR